MAVGEAEVLETILTLCLLIFAAKGGGEIAQRLGVAAVVGELLAGVLLSPALLGGTELFGYRLVNINETVKVFAEIGAILLLFLIGLEMQFAQFRKTGGIALSVALGGIAVPFTLGYYFVLFTGGTREEALLIGAALTATSIAITVKTLYDMGRGTARESRIIVSAAVFDDVLGLVVLAVVLAIIKSGSITLADTLLIAGKAVLAWVFLTLAGILVFSRIVTTAAPFIKTRGGKEALAVASCFGFAYIAGIAGLAPILGAFAAGMAIAETKLIQSIHKFIEKVNFMMAPLFFTVIGTQVNIQTLDASSLGFAAALFVIAVVSKVAGCGIPVYLSTRDRRSAAVVGVGMVSRGEVGLIITGIGATSGVFSPEVFSAAVLVVLATTVLTPVVLKRLFAA
ncbi:MAG: cation:proton antiporter [Euryarchaeota archaeon]|nr:cation:proton antiporter [Euryarchaeota archaeon]